jgi:NTP pyrophosphatase (non-canonical NTP hydrolase)
MADLSDLQRKVVKFRDARDWKQFHNPKDLALSLVLEASELLEHFQWKTTEEIEQYLKEKNNEVSEEIIDVLYWVLLFAYDLGIDIEKEFDRKMKQNEKKYPVSKAKGSHKKYTELAKE